MLKSLLILSLSLSIANTFARSTTDCQTYGDREFCPGDSVLYGNYEYTIQSTTTGRKYVYLHNGSRVKAESLLREVKVVNGKQCFKNSVGARFCSGTSLFLENTRSNKLSNFKTITKIFETGIVKSSYYYFQNAKDTENVTLVNNSVINVDNFTAAHFIKKSTCANDVCVNDEKAFLYAIDAKRPSINRWAKGKVVSVLSNDRYILSLNGNFRLIPFKNILESEPTRTQEKCSSVFKSLCVGDLIISLPKYRYKITGRISIDSVVEAIYTDGSVLLSNVGIRSPSRFFQTTWINDDELENKNENYYTTSEVADFVNRGFISSRDLVTSPYKSNCYQSANEDYSFGGLLVQDREWIQNWESFKELKTEQFELYGTITNNRNYEFNYNAPRKMSLLDSCDIFSSDF